MVLYQYNWSFCTNIALELWFIMEKLRTMKKTMILYRKLWNFDKLWKKLYGTNEKNYGTILNYI